MVGARAAHGASAESSSASTARSGRCVAGASIGGRRFRLDVVGIRRDVIDVGAGRVEGRRAELLTRAHFGNVGIEQTADVDHRIAFMVGGDVERHNNRGVVGILHRFGDRCIGLGGDAEIDISKIDAVVVQFPSDDAIGDLRAAIAHADRGLGDLGVPEKLRIELGFRNLVKEALADLVNGEQTLFCLRILSNDAIVRLRVGSGQGGVPASSSTACAGGLRRFVLGEDREREE